MKLSTSFILAGLATVSTTYAAPAAERGIFDDVQITDDLLLFDAPAFPNPANPSETLVGLSTFVTLKQSQSAEEIGIGLILDFLSGLGIDFAKNLKNVQDRVRGLFAIGLPGKATTITVPGCSGTPRTALTELLPNLGASFSIQSLGRCTGSAASAKELIGTAGLTFLDSRKISASIFPSPNSGFGVISDIDDTVKISNVLDKIALLKSTLLDDPKPVVGMPALYSSLSKTLPTPQFIYITGSPVQLYPLLNTFIDTSFPDAKGPIFAQNLTIINPVEIFEFLGGNNDKTFNHKIAQIAKVQAMYPNKKWLAIGDSTQKDPEVYAQAFKQFGNAISCIWIRKVEGADNSAARFTAATQGVPANKFRTFEDKDIASLAQINVAGGQC